MNINCRNVINKRYELAAAIEYLKFDVICGTETWLKEVKPGSKPSSDAQRSSVMFPTHYKAFRNDRTAMDGGVFILVNQDKVANEQAEYVTVRLIGYQPVQSFRTRQDPKPSSVIFQMSIDAETLSPDWRNANIAPILRMEIATFPRTIDLSRSPL